MVVIVVASRRRVACLGLHLNNYFIVRDVMGKFVLQKYLCVSFTPCLLPFLKVVVGFSRPRTNKIGNHCTTGSHGQSNSLRHCSGPINIATVDRSSNIIATNSNIIAILSHNNFFLCLSFISCVQAFSFCSMDGLHHQIVIPKVSVFDQKQNSLKHLGCHCSSLVAEHGAGDAPQSFNC